MHHGAQFRLAVQNVARYHSQTQTDGNYQTYYLPSFGVYKNTKQLCYWSTPSWNLWGARGNREKRNFRGPSPGKKNLEGLPPRKKIGKAFSRKIHFPREGPFKKFFPEKGLRNFFFLNFLRPSPQIINGRPLSSCKCKDNLKSGKKAACYFWFHRKSRRPGLLK